jgi:hypothetical protein
MNTVTHTIMTTIMYHVSSLHRPAFISQQRENRWRSAVLQLLDVLSETLRFGLRACRTNFVVDWRKASPLVPKTRYKLWRRWGPPKGNDAWEGPQTYSRLRRCRSLRIYSVILRDVGGTSVKTTNWHRLSTLRGGGGSPLLITNKYNSFNYT